MKTEICKRLGIEFPIFAFSHCRDVVAAVSNAGGFGMLGAVGFSADQLRVELDWLDEHVVGGYGVDIVIPGKYVGMGEMDVEKLQAMLAAQIPAEHRAFAKKLLADHDVPELATDEKPRELLGWTEATAGLQVEVALQHPKVRAFANALGTPPADVIKEIQSTGRLVGALCGSAKQAQSHKEAGLDFIIAQGTEGGGHTGEIGSIVLWPEVIEVAGDIPVLAAGGIGSGKQMAAAMALGAQGVWTGSIWLTVTEADTPPAQKESFLKATSRDTIRSRSWTGKPCRMLKNDWTEAWDKPENPKPLGMPLQFMVTSEAVVRGHHYAAKAQKVGFNPVGQIVGRMNDIRSARRVIEDMVQDYIDATERLQRLLA
ncbi:MAG: nitronate monooxygenase family protein [Candidatus Binatia bacterium]